MDRRTLLFFAIECGLAWPITVSSSSPAWVQLSIFLAGNALFFAIALYALNPHWGREYPRLHRRVILATAVLTLAVLTLFLLFGERSFETALGRGSRPALFLLYLLVFSGTARRLVPRR